MSRNAEVNVMDDGKLDNAVKTLTVIWGSMVVSVLIYMFAIPQVIGETIDIQLPPEVYQLLRTVLYIVSFGLILGARFISKYMLSGKGGSLQNTGSTSNPALPRYTTAMIMALALSEAVAIFGLVLFLMARDIMSLYFLGAVSILSMFMYRPSRENIVEGKRPIKNSCLSRS
jgi:F0F1-type ATP synthase membrane subunit c/vacuolar-type H+-ATPase subunit K